TWEARDRKALSIMQGHISNELVMEFSAIKMSKALMDALILKSEGTNTGPRAFLVFKAMVDTKWDGKDDISNVISHIRTYQQNLTALGFPLDNTILAFVFLYALPDTPENAQLWSMITSSVPKNEKLTFTHVKSHFT
ncbi:hypothetical protein FIBSPDRAFT_707950, partial [Athelia psychrophila]